MATSRIPIALFGVISSFKKIRDKITMKIGNVIDIKERFMAVVVWPAMYIKVLNIVIPNTAITLKYGKCFFMMLHSVIRDFKAKGKKAIMATTHLQKARLVGGMVSLRPRAIMKLPDQIAVAARAKK